MNSAAAVSTRGRTCGMSSTSTISEQDFTTPDRSKAKALALAAVTGSHPEEKKQVDILNRVNGNTRNTQSSAALVTPLDAFSTAVARKEAAAAVLAASKLDINNKQVRFDGKNNKNTKEDAIETTTLCTAELDEGDSSSSSTFSPSSASKRGLVSRRGGRCGSPGRIHLQPPPSAGAKEAVDAVAAAVMEFKTFRSPGRNYNNSNCENNNENREGSSSGDTVPSLCSSNSTDRKESNNRDNKNSSSIVTTTTNTTATIKGSLSQQHARRQHNPQSKAKPTSVSLLKKTTMASFSTAASIHKKSSSASFSPVPTSSITGHKVS